jgi:carboxylesterase
MCKNKKQLRILEGAEPLYLKGNEIGFLFIHGFTASPYEGRELAIKLNTNLGCTASVPLLPGHGISPRSLKGIIWQDWYNCVKEKYFVMKKECKKIFICGQSMGGALVLHLASHHPVDGIISLAGAAFLKDWRLKLLPFARCFLTYQHKSKGPDIKNKSLKSKVPSYKKYPLQSLEEMLALLKHLRDDLIEISAPALLIHSQNDRTVHFDNLNYIFEQISSTHKKKMILEESYHVLSIDVEKDKVFKQIETFISEIIHK